MSATLFSPRRLGPLTLPNRLVMAPMTRPRAGAGAVPTPLTVEYYVQRASAGLIVTEATQVSAQGAGYLNTPGIHTAAQERAWRRVTEAVHAHGGRIFLQLWHVGRISHPSFQPDGARPVAPSAITPIGFALTAGGRERFVTPRALDLDEIPGVVADFRRAAERAGAAGFDGVEIHGANGYLPQQFLEDGTNRRTDAYGGSIENRARFLLEITDVVAAVWGPERVGVRVSPATTFNGMSGSDPAGTYGYVAEQLEQRGIGYLHLVEPVEPIIHDGKPVSALAHLRERFRGAIIANNGLDAERAAKLLADGAADLVAFGRLFLANPDLPARLRAGSPLNPPDPATFYGGDEHGYTDYPVLAAS